MPERVLLLGATGSIGRAVLVELLARGHEVTCLVRTASGHSLPAAADVILGEVSDPADVARCFAAARFDAVVSCLASRTGTPKEAWQIDHAAHAGVLAAAQRAGVRQMVLLSAICVQRPKLAFQHAKLAFEAELQRSGLIWSIVRPTAYFKSLSGQVARVKAGKPFLVFGDGRLTACKPISDRDLAGYMVDCLSDPAKWNRILPIGGPGPAETPREMGEALFAALGRPAKFRQVPVAMLDVIIAVLSVLGLVSGRAAEKAELARIGRYYATQSMLVWDPAKGRFDAGATPETGQDRLRDHHARMIAGEVQSDLGAHAVFAQG